MARDRIEKEMSLLMRRRLERDCVCAICGAPLVTPAGEKAPVCARAGRRHKGYMSGATWERRQRERTLAELEEEFTGRRPRKGAVGDLEDLYG